MVSEIIIKDIIRQCSLILPKHGYSDFKIFLNLMHNYIKLEEFAIIHKILTRIVNNISEYMDITYGIEKNNLYDIVLQLLTIEI